ncbi:hypothetical protein CCHR01_04056 [Colletotrichum chrysophilum]|uniref:Uncharacterized protein n=1 Tax=Colletotrichum chrysophilum TaxID=1836956 RepID=A0AAD9ELV8_9PEZI|nr:hypothetical protein CCHR01_04056 [Colletotrichum chrysophilum]
MTFNSQCQANLIEGVVYCTRFYTVVSLLVCRRHFFHLFKQITGSHVGLSLVAGPPVAHGNCSALDVLGAHHNAETVLLALRLCNLLRQRPLAGINFNCEAGRLRLPCPIMTMARQDVLDFRSPLQDRLRVVEAQDCNLAWVQPERPLALVLLDQKRHQTLNGSQDGAVNQYGRHHAVLLQLCRVNFLQWHALSLLFWRGCAILKLESLRELEVELNGASLVRLPVRVTQHDVDLWTVECAVSLLDRVLQPSLLKSIAQLRLCALPFRIGADVMIRRPGRQRKIKVIQAQGPVYSLHEVERLEDLFPDLDRSAEDVAIVLVETSHARQATEGARDLVPVQRTEVGVTNGKIAVAAVLRGEDEAMPRAVHRLEAIVLVLALRQSTLSTFALLGGLSITTAARCRSLGGARTAGDGIHVVGIVLQVA